MVIQLWGYHQPNILMGYTVKGFSSPTYVCIYIYNIYKSGWWYTYPSEKYEFVSWDYDIPNMWKK